MAVRSRVKYAAVVSLDSLCLFPHYFLYDISHFSLCCKIPVQLIWKKPFNLLSLCPNSALEEFGEIKISPVNSILCTLAKMKVFFCLPVGQVHRSVLPTHFYPSDRGSKSSKRMVVVGRIVFTPSIFNLRLHDFKPVFFMLCLCVHPVRYKKPIQLPDWNRWTA